MTKSCSTVPCQPPRLGTAKSIGNRPYVCVIIQIQVRRRDVERSHVEKRFRDFYCVALSIVFFTNIHIRSLLVSKAAREKSYTHHQTHYLLRPENTTTEKERGEKHHPKEGGAKAPQLQGRRDGGKLRVLLAPPLAQPSA